MIRGVLCLRLVFGEHVGVCVCVSVLVTFGL